LISQYVLRFLEMMKNNKLRVVTFHYLVRPFTCQQRTVLKQFILSLFKKEQKKLDSLRFIFCSDEYLLSINKRFLQHDYYTDIITFNLASENEKIVGEVYISIDRVRDNAKTLNEPFNRELQRVIFHGSLHLCGYRDKTKREIIIMRNKEDFYLHDYNNSAVPRGTK
jgi:probable rRNA maturation factor